MPRSRRLVAPALMHHVVHRGINRQPIFLDDTDRRTFLAILSRASAKTGASLYAFCLMTNHFHLLLADERGRLSELMQLLNGRYTLRFNERHLTEGALLRGRFYSRPLQSAQDARNVFRYIHLNPVKAKMVDNPAAFVWSSFSEYANARWHYISDQGFARALAAEGLGPQLLTRWLIAGVEGLELRAPPRPRDLDDVNVSPAEALASSDSARSVRRRQCAALLAALPPELRARMTQPRGRGRVQICHARGELMLKCIEQFGASYAELSEVFVMSPRSVGNTVARARARRWRVRQSVDESVDEGSDPVVGGEGFEPPTRGV